MNRLGDQFLARPAFALQQHRRAAGRHLRDQIENLQHGLALAHDVFKVVALLERALQLNVFFFRLLAGDGGAHVGQQFLVVPRLLDEVGGAGLHGAHRVLHRPIGGDHDDGLLRMQQPNLGEHVHPVLVGQRQVEQDHVESALSNLRQTFASAARDDDGIAFELKQRLQRFADLRFVVNDEDSARALRRAFPACSGAGSALLQTLLLQTWTAFLVDINGKSRVKVVPSPGRLSTRILPACSWMMP